MKKNYIILLVILVLVVGVFLFKYIPTEDGFFKVRLYDADGNLISNSLSVVNGVPGVSYIDLTVTVENVGGVPLTCNLISLTPTAFSDALSPIEKIVPSSNPKKASWTSNLISVSELELLTQPVTFSATARCTYNSGTSMITLDDKTGTINLNIQPDDSGAGFEINVDSGGSPSEFCGDGICQSYENPSSCPGDCGIFPTARFRTSDLSYVSGSAIGFTETCGDVLTAYGFIANTGLLSGSCSDGMPSASWCGSNTLLLSDLPGGIPMRDGIATLWKSNVAGRLCVCDDGSDGKYQIVKYETGSSYSDNVDIDPISTGSREVLC